MKKKKYEYQKLIDLLNEYDGKNHWWDYDEEDLDIKEEDNYVLEIISKKFWFIEWLVENEKIDVERVKESWFITRTFDLDECWEPYSDLESLLMLLSIQDEPISFLISLLK